MLRSQTTWLSILLALCYAERYLLPVLLVELDRHWSASFVQLGLVLSSLPLGYHLGSLATQGRHVWLPRPSFGLILAGVGAGISGLAPNLGWFSLGRVIGGVGCGWYAAALPLRLRKIETGDGQSSWARAMMLAMPAGIAMAMILGGPIASTVGIRTLMFLFVGAYALAYLHAAQTGDLRDQEPVHPSPSLRRPISSDAGVMLMVAGSALYTFSFGILVSWFPSWAVRSLGWSTAQIGSILAVLVVAAVPAGLYVGRRYGRLFCNLDWRAEGYALFAGVGSLTSTLPLLLAMFSNGFWGLVVPLAAHVLLASACLPAALRTLQAAHGSHSMRQLFSIVTLAAFVLGDLLPGVLGGFIADRLHLSVVMALVPLTMTGAGLSFIWGSRQSYRASPGARETFPVPPLLVGMTRVSQWFFRRVARIFFSELVVLRSDGDEQATMVRDPELDPEAPTLLIANHPNGLIDPVLMYCTAGQPLRGVAKATLWQSPILRPLLSVAGAVPIVRQQDREILAKAMPQIMSAIESNDDAIQFVAQALCRHSFVIYPEGRSHDEPEMSEFKTGGARMLLGAAALVARAARAQMAPPVAPQEDVVAGFLAPKIGGPGDMGFQPVGLYFDNKNAFRSRAVVHYGRRIALKEVFDEQELTQLAEGAKAPQLVKKLTKAMDVALRSILPEAPDANTLHYMQTLATLMAEPRHRLRIDERYRSELLVKSLIVLARELPREQRQALAKFMDEYEGRRLELGVSDALLRDVASEPRLFRRQAWRRTVLSLLSLPLVLPAVGIGIALFGWVNWLVGKLASKLSPDTTEIATYKLLGGIIFVGAACAGYAALTVAFFLGAGWYGWLVVAPFLPALCGYAALRFHELLKAWGPDRRILRQPEFWRRVQELAGIRQQLVQKLTATLENMSSPPTAG